MKNGSKQDTLVIYLARVSSDEGIHVIVSDSKFVVQSNCTLLCSKTIAEGNRHVKPL